jgi:hypothetical protein
MWRRFAILLFSDDDAARGVAVEYQVVAFDPVSNRAAGSTQVAAELESLIDSYAREGWEYVRLETISAVMPGTGGCFGFGAQPPSNIFFGMAVFRR